MIEYILDTLLVAASIWLLIGVNNTWVKNPPTTKLETTAMAIVILVVSFNLAVAAH